VTFPVEPEQCLDGKQLIEQVMVNRGGPDRPLDDRELAAKLADCAERVLSAADVKSVRAAIESLPSVGTGALANAAESEMTG
jgi:hypothetical protein